MRILGIHTNFFKFKATEKATQAAEEKAQKFFELNEECIVIFVAVEREDEDNPESIVKQLVKDTLKRSKELKVKTVVIYPYVHLTQNPGSSRTALKILKNIENELSKELKVIRSPFGWYKSFEISCKGHPLSEWSAEYHSKEKLKEKKETKAKFTRFLLVNLQGDIFEITPSSFKDCPIFKGKEPVYRLLKQFVSNELGQGIQTTEIPRHITYMRQHELVDYCDVSEKGHYKWYPKGLLIQKLILDYAARLAREWGAFEMKNPLLIRGDNNLIGELMGEFHERDYRVDGGRGIGYLRYASDPLGFPFMQKVRFTYKQSPLKVYEEATCFRNEQEGEVSGLKRVRNFLMTDMHAACSSVEEAKREFETLCYRFGELMNDIIAKGRWILGWEGTVDFFEENKEYLINIGKNMGVPAFFKLMPRMTHYYIIKNEYQSITQDKSNIQVSTVQWDIKDGKRFNIGYIDEKGEKHPSPVIIHASSFGSIERTLCVILENIAIDAEKGIPPMLPLWLSPAQVRIINVSDSYLDFALKICEEISSYNIRVDVDDRKETVGKKIRNGEIEWIPYLLVVGEKEKTSGLLTVRSREQGKQEKMRLEDFAKMIKDKTKGMPFRPLPLPKLVSKRPIFYS